MRSGEIDAALAGATPYLRQFGMVLGGWLMARAAVAALEERDIEDEFSSQKVITARFYGEQLLPQAGGLISAVEGGASLLDQAVL